jgi:chemotaxis protein CheZ
MLDASNTAGLRGVEALRESLGAIRARKPDLEPGMISEVVRAVLTTMSDELTAKEASLLQEVEELAQTIATAKTEIAALRVDDITDHDIPFATDELDAIVGHTAQATHAILESCETLDEVAATVTGDAAAKLQDATTRIYEACSFQDITGQRITKIVATLKTIERKIAHIINTFGPGITHVAEHSSQEAMTDAGLLNGPQLPAHAMDQSDIDKLMASFE